MKAVILAGGFGSRISEESHLKPKPLIEIGGKPILWHIMKTYSAHGINDFIICCGFKGFLRGLHFQLPPHDHAKLVYCIAGSVEDMALDIRVGSPTYGKTVMLELSARKGNMIYLPKGLAHGFCTPNEQATLVYNVSSVYESEADSGIRWDSVGVHWPIQNPLLSNRDQSLPTFDEFKSPFDYTELTKHAHWG